jgi:hypothetical protein
VNQYRGHWLLNDALNFVISISLKFKNEIDFTTFDNLMEEDANVVLELSCLVSNIRVLNCFLSFLKKYEKKSPIYAFLDVKP